ncbi:MAG: MFS transporter [Deltaproteobacteria bacterium]|nr:MFS transporter [Deltaproteobacteria bacterium]
MMFKNIETKSLYRWLVVFIGFYGMCLHAGCLIYASGLFIKPLQTYFGWERGTIALAFTLQFVFLGLLSPFIGKAVDRFGPRIVFISGAAISSIGFLMMPMIKTPAHFYLLSILIGMAETAIGPVPCTGAVSPLFNKKRGLAVGIVSTGIGVGGFIFSILVGSLLIPSYGWQGGYYGIAAAHLIIIPMAMFMRGKNKQTALRHEEAAETSGIKTDELRSMLRSPSLWIIAVTFFMFLFSLVGTVQIQAPHLQDIGFPVLMASTTLGYLALVSAFAKLFFGWLCDKINPKTAYIISAACLVFGLAMLSFFRHDSSPVYLWTYVIIFGIGIGAWLPIMSMMTSRTFGTGSYGLYFGAITMVETIGQALGPLVAGLMFDSTGSYHSTFNLYIILTVASLITASLIKGTHATVRRYDLEGLKDIKINMVGTHNRVPSIG